MVLELHECVATLTRFAKALRSQGLESQALSLACFESNGCRLGAARLILLVPDADTMSPSQTLRRVAIHLAYVPAIALLHAHQHARQVDWFASGIHVLTRLPITHYALGLQVRALLSLPGISSNRPVPPTMSLTRIERRILELLASRQGRPFSRSTILRHIYDDHRIVCERTVDAHVKNLRRKLHSSDAIVRSVYGEGYLLDLERSVT